MVGATVDQIGVGARPRPGTVLAAVALGVVSVGALGVGIADAARHHVGVTHAVGFGLVGAWILAGVVGITRRPMQVPGVIVLVGAACAAVALSSADLAPVVSPLVVGVSFHLLLALPDGRLHGTGRRAAVAVGYGAVAVVAIVMAASGDRLSGVTLTVAWVLALAAALPALQARYRTSAAADRQRMQWAGIGVVVAADAALVGAVLHILVSWPSDLASVAAAATVFVPLGAVAGNVPAVGPRAGRLSVQVLSIAGFTVVVSLTYLVIVRGLGRAPTNSGDREVLGLSMLAAAVAAVGYGPARDRLVASATRLVYGARHAPDEVVRTFGSRMTRAVSMEELLLQLAESLRRTLGLVSAEVYTGSGEVLEPAALVPDVEPRTVVVGGRERPIIARAGVSGNAWAAVWLPALLTGRDDSQLRVAPVSHAGELLGLIVAQRAPAADSFTADEDRVLADLARQVGLAFHNAQLDTALQSTLDELRRQADELRESRARIVASGDAERRRVERNLHDGAQQRLVALAVNLRLAKDIVSEDPASGGEMLDALIDEVRETIQELRELAHGLFPPLLVDAGLAPALRAAANRSALRVELVADGIGRYPAEVEAAIYFCCVEALQNAAKHAPDATVTVRVSEESGGLLFSVADDGPGFDPAQASAGHGFVNMSDRVGAIGGTVRWESHPGDGAVVRGSIPLAYNPENDPDSR